MIKAIVVTFRYDLCPITLTSSLYSIFIVTVLFLMLITDIPAAFSEEVVTIIPCSSNHNNAKSKTHRLRIFN